MGNSGEQLHVERGQQSFLRKNAIKQLDQQRGEFSKTHLKVASSSTAVQIFFALITCSQRAKNFLWIGDSPESAV